MILSNNGYDQLKTVVVGRELNIPKRIADITFKHFYNSNLNQGIYDKLVVQDETYTINHELIVQRNLELDNLSYLLSNQGVKVHRPDELSKVIPFKTPDFKSEVSSASNVRDITLVLGDKIIETPTYVLNRYLENTLLYDVYNEEFNNGRGGQWIRCPHTKLTKDTIDLDHWTQARDYNNFDYSKYVMAIDGAQFLRLDNDVIVNVSSYNHYLGYLWVKSFYPDLTFHMVSVVDNHIDGSLVALAPGKFLVNPKDEQVLREQLPKKFQSWDFIIPTEFSKFDTETDWQLASTRGMDINILSINHDTVIVNEAAVGVQDVLDKNGFNILTTPLNNCEIFGGGIHCSTLDIYRET